MGKNDSKCIRTVRYVYFSTVYTYAPVLLFVYFNHHGHRITFQQNASNARPLFRSARVFHLLAIVQDEIHVLVETDDLAFQNVPVRGVFVQPDLDSAFRLQETEDEVDRLRHYALDFRRHDD